MVKIRNAVLVVMAISVAACEDPAGVGLRLETRAGTAGDIISPGSAAVCSQGAAGRFEVRINGGAPRLQEVAGGTCLVVHAVSNGRTDRVLVTAVIGTVIADSITKDSVRQRSIVHLGPWIGYESVTMVVSRTVGATATYWMTVGQPEMSWSLETMPGENISGIWASGPDDVFASGGFRTLNHFDGVRWSAMSHPPGANRYKVFGIRPDAVWAVGQWGVLRYDGAVWSAMPSTGGGEIVDVWAASETELFVSGDGTLQRWNGVNWTSLPVNVGGVRLNVWGSSPSDVYASGWGGQIVHFDGNTVTPVTAPVVADWEDMSGTGPNDVWIVGGFGDVLHFDGVTWRAVNIGTTAELSGVWALSRDLVYITGADGLHRWDGIEWSMVDTGISSGFNTVFALSPSLIYLGLGGPGSVLVGRGQQADP